VTRRGSNPVGSSQEKGTEMATLSAVTVKVVSKAFTGGTAQGQAAGFVPVSAGGDLIPLSGQGVLVTAKSTGTASTVTFNSVAPSSYGDDKDVTMVLAATDEQELFIKNDGRFDQGGVNAGLMAVTYSADTGVSIKAKIIPGL
jgi:hypothetical protein